MSTTAAIEIDTCDGKVQITNKAKVQMFAGDRGTDVEATVELTPGELKTHIAALCRVWRRLQETP